MRRPDERNTGWRRAAVFNSVAVGCFAILLLGVLSRSASQAGSLTKAWLFFEGDCDQSSRLNLYLHLLLNVFSTLIIASSNFFMQVLNAPTREDVDRAHAKNRWLEIGVPSIRNILHLSRFKTIAWVLFNVTSIPIHLLFNSAIFQTDYQGNTWQLTLASEAFIEGSSYYGPGAGLVLSGARFGEYDPSWASPKYPVQFGTGLHDAQDPSDPSYFVNISDYLSSQSPTGRYLANVSTSALSWKNISAEECRNEYQTCQARRRYRDVLVVLDVHGEPDGYDGWVLDDIYDMSNISDSLPYASTDNETYSDLWQKYLPTSEQNSLWFTGYCLTWGLVGVNGEGFSAPACENYCIGPLGLADALLEVEGSTGLYMSGTTLDRKVARPTGSSWTIPWVSDGKWAENQDISRPFYRDDDLADLNVRYCLVEEQEPTCKVGLMTPLLGVTTLCVVLKVILCIVVVAKLSDQPLVTPGDAIESFIVTPDPITLGKATLTAQDCSKKHDASEFAPGPRQWKKTWRYWASGVPGWAWARTYLLCLIVLGCVGGLMSRAMTSSPLKNSGALLDHDSNAEGGGMINGNFFTQGSMVIAVITANVPQIILSLSYFSYNALFTRMQAEAEWNAFSIRYQPLRVTSPRGDQRSTYRLQLPYSYSIPLQAISILLHWIVSNTIYVVVVEGGYYSGGLSGSADWMIHAVGPDNSYGLAPDSFIGIGFSSGAILLVFCLGLALLIVPLALGWRKYQGVMVVAAANSMVMSAACHVSAALETRNPSKTNSASFEHVKSEKSIAGEWMYGLRRLTGQKMSEGQSLLQQSRPDDTFADGNKDDGVKMVGREIILEDDGMPDLLRRMRIARSKLKWGVVKMPAEFYEQFRGTDTETLHLAFGVEEQEVYAPEEGRWYA